MNKKNEKSRGFLGYIILSYHIFIYNIQVLNVYLYFIYLKNGNEND